MPDISGYEIVEYDVNEEIKKQYNITDIDSDEEEPDLLEDKEQQ